MFFFSPPTPPPQETRAPIAQASHAGKGSPAMRKVGICQPVSTFQTPPPESQQGDYVIEPIGEARDYFGKYEHKKITATANASIPVGPKHGSLTGSGEAYVYLPNANYLGGDGATFLVNLGDQQVSVVYYFYVTPGPVEEGEDTADSGARYKKLCPHGYSWKISGLSPGQQAGFH